ncbi:LysR family transcriptional regulator [Vibrio genomosp. F10]|uniref:LysR family transcriptional regulator n=2 Tax=Vibrio genomosp. F10 TaxID=723171 RepID=A0A1B9QWX4_9VIBR|nr:LysR family transcriptional regulator [Vibrio genomosp. F10]OCH74286.1 LysR family transcriptional regulator [Vibrio genomosp. F10]OEE35847.1 LysR family transcriptional regulator [Vibrio genomosp. F10 str. ZF-129]OEE96583.1 LysR family transcriptional regulator [Vibrio genomosp. F10 str. 9ZC157]OEE97369.1 LysR family transcriptional regulator [Vibrio genomosp. F10 str. 9ZD137]OEF03839.1 LysR family transcriptional regulator [Vibrio genomosp. F10 str. 9ZB36]
MSLVNQLSLFIDVVQQGSFTKAAALHDMDNSSLSKQIKKLERELGVQLLNRSTRSFSLTSAGEEILEQAHSLVSTLGNVKTIAESYHTELKGRIRMTAPLHIGQYYLQPVITQFMKRYPEIEVTLLMDDKRSDIISDQLDVAFRFGRLEDSSLIARKIADIRSVILASNDFIALHGEPTTPEELTKLPSVIYSNGNITVDTLRFKETPGSNELTSYKMKGKYRVNDVSTLISSVKESLGYAMIASSNLSCPIEDMNLKPLLTQYTLCNQGLGLYALYPHRKQTALITEFIKAVQNYIGDKPLWEQHIAHFDTLYKRNE